MTKKSQPKMFHIERVDVSWINIEANSPEEALELSNHPDYIEQWCFNVGEPAVSEE